MFVKSTRFKQVCQLLLSLIVATLRACCDYLAAQCIILATKEAKTFAIIESISMLLT